MKKGAAIVLAIITFAMGYLASEYKVVDRIKGEPEKQEIAEEESTWDGIDRYQYERYPRDQYKWESGCCVNLYSNDKYYHKNNGCAFWPESYNKRVLLISVYEAVERGYTPCPNCIVPEVKIK